MITATESKANDLMTEAHIRQYWEEGYTIVKGVFNEAELNQMRTACDHWKFMGDLLGRTWRKQNTVIWVDEDQDVGTTVRGMQWPSYHDAVMDKYRTDPRMLMLIEPLIGNNIKQIINQVHWKRPGSRTSWPLHRDVRSRQPSSDFFDLYESWVQTGIGIDPHMKDNGAMQLVPGSHKDIPHDPDDKSSWQATQYANDNRIKDMVLEPGDVGLWSAYTVHGGGFNTTKYLDRRLYINGFVKAEKCKRGEWAWKDGRTVHLYGEPALIQFDEVDEIRHAFYAAELNRKELIRD
ncbi:phytanoyl-CoA dioxygenase family protein [Cerasicoccus arenae]|uniref:Phytanoyl-CoA dioxygenase n=1 Tax=Cerasicoccus arenae TaxID=424488 RepID=A0A8J3GBU5_9BACT|nr:phytanoyl-CoA dioxygenase family protein [Cerasicoccus arenae]MBK1859928.1 phytanoyl-CoA dioxygenase family protein [Cerasicoccus arenae]GHB93454.1 phytanoyl-CoA dioxygenase [Cerasicoccus arenae]